MMIGLMMIGLSAVVFCLAVLSFCYVLPSCRQLILTVWRMATNNVDENDTKKSSGTTDLRPLI